MEKPVGVKAGGFNYLVRRWALPTKRTLGTWAFVFNRWSGVLLAIYLYVHLGILTSLAFKPAAYDRFLIIARSPLGLAFDAGLLLLLLYHGLNGLRIIYITWTGKIEQHRPQFWGVVAMALAVALYSLILIVGYE